MNPCANIDRTPTISSIERGKNRECKEWHAHVRVGMNGNL